MTKSQRQHGIGSLAPDEKIVGKPGGIVEAGVKQYGIFKKIKKGVKKVFKSKLGKAALLAGGAYFAPMMWGQGAGLGGWKAGLGALRNKAFGAGAGKFLSSGGSPVISNAPIWMRSPLPLLLMR